MKKVLLKHLTEYLLLALVMSVGFLIVKYVPTLAWKVILIFSLAAFYFGYGSYHHFSEKSLKLVTVLEYSLVASIVAITLLVLFS